MPESAIRRLEQALDRLEATEPSVRAYVCVDAEAARAAASAVDAREPSGPLHGVPFAVKEVISAAGMPAAGGSRALADRVPGPDATVVSRLREAGAVLMGTQVSHELTCGLDQPPTRNPWALDRYPGGSTAGGGASVAVGSARLALGTDAAGSVRIPGAMTGVVGLKPTAGLVSSHGIVRQATAPSIDHVGVLARRVAEAADALAVIAGPDPADAATLRESRAGAPGAGLSAEAPLPLAGRRVAVLSEATQADLDRQVEPEPDVVAAVAAACRELRELGATLVPVELPSLARSAAAVFTLFSTELAAAHRGLLDRRRADYHPAVAAMLEQALRTPSRDVVEAVAVRTRLRAEIRDALAAAGAEVMVTPTTPRAAMPLEGFDPQEELGTLIPYTCPFNLTGQPAISVPCGFTGEGMPVGLQIAGLHWGEDAVIRVAAAYERATQWHNRLPPGGA